jgi:hypothetical protein
LAAAGPPAAGAVEIVRTKLIAVQKAHIAAVSQADIGMRIRQNLPTRPTKSRISTGPESNH